MTLATVVESTGLRTTFDRRGDRFAHGVAVLIAGRWIDVLSSVEGEPDDAWPPSPPLQEVSLHDAEGRPMALSVGMAGKSHWSLSVLADPAGGLVFDVACRVRGESLLGSTYRALAGQWTLGPSSNAMLVTEGSAASIGLVADPDYANLKLSSDRTCLIVQPVNNSVADRPHTFRWRYEVRRS